MSVDWDGYEIYHPGVVGALNTLPRAEARRAFNKRMEDKRARVEMLRWLLKANGVELATTDGGIQDLNDWFRANVEADADQPGRLSADWYSVVNDVAMFLGDVMIERCPGLRWEFFTWGKKDAAYQRHVIMGFSQVANAKFNIDIDRAVAVYGHRIVASRGSVPLYGARVVRGVEIDVDAAAARGRQREVEEDAFWQWVKLAESKA
jgi:hypothetical protein